MPLLLQQPERNNVERLYNCLPTTVHLLDFCLESQHSIMSNSPVLIIGAGFSGACAALRLSKLGLRSIVLEARDRIGGRTFTQDIGGNAIDGGLTLLVVD